MPAVSGTPSGLVEIVREFLAVDRAVRRLISRFRSGILRFDEVTALFTDEEESALFRLKEHCHALFRPRQGPAAQPLHREVLFDLAVGSLFHEAMQFRESFYQREVYGPRVRALQHEVGAEAEALFREFERILPAVSGRLEAGLGETETLLDRCREQLEVLMREHADDGYVTRFLIEHRDDVEAVFSSGLEALLASVYGDPAEGYALAGSSYLESGYFEDAEAALYEASARSGDRERFAAARAHARGMAAYLRGRYGEALSELEQWLDLGPLEPRLAERALHAFAKVGDLIVGDARAGVVERAGRFVARLLELQPELRLAGARKGA